MGSRRDFLSTAAALGRAAAGGGCALMMAKEPADTLIVNARIATLDPRQPGAEAIAIRGETILAVGSAVDLNGYKNEKTQMIDAGRRTIVPGLNDAHTHFIRGGLTYTNEVRWDGLPSLAECLRRVRE